MLRYALTCSCQRSLEGLSNNQGGTFPTSFLCGIQSWLVLVTKLIPCGMWVHFCSSCCPKEQPTSYTQSHADSPPRQLWLKELPRGVLLMAFPHFLIRKFLYVESYLLPCMKIDQEVENASTGQWWTVDQFLLCSIQTKRGYILPLFYLKYKCWSLKHFLPGWVACNSLYK